MERNVNRKKYFPSDAEEEFDLQDEIQGSQHRRNENEKSPRTTGKESHFRHERSKGHGDDSNHQSDKIASPQARLRGRER
jgi:hypothetical protein